MPGHPGRSLIEKLGIREGSSIALVGAPANYRARLGALPKGAKIDRAKDYLDVVQIFAQDKASLDKKILTAKRNMKQNGTIWVSWPKLSSGLETDLSSDVVREAGLANGLVDVKICSIDDTWSALKFVIRLRDRTSQV